MVWLFMSGKDEVHYKGDYYKDSRVSNIWNKIQLGVVQLLV